LVDISDYDGGYGFPYPSRYAKALPDGSGVFYAGYLLDGSDLSILQYPLNATIRSVTPNGALAISQTTVYHAATGVVAGPLPTSGAVQAVSPDGATLYVWTGMGLSTVDLTTY